MRVITHCPACHTQFFATEQQLNQHDGKVRCGQCMQVFDARAQILNLTDEVEKNIGIREELNELNKPDTIATAESAGDDSISVQPAQTQSKNSTHIIPEQPAYFDSISSKAKLKRQLPTNRFKSWLWLLAVLAALLLIIAQVLYFLRNEIAMNYSQFKPALMHACQWLNCNIELPKQIEFIIIDDSDMREDAERSGLVYFSTSLMNTGSHTVAFPDLELTLTDTVDKPVLRRLFRPIEYLNKQLPIEQGFKSGMEVKVKLAITTGDTAVSGYRVFVTY
jgi:predicted Zn finger-like uncharacterized protein